MNTKLRDKADRLFAARIRSRGRCECCGFTANEWTSMECAHVLSRRYYAIRWSEENAVCLCGDAFGCHAYFTAHPAKWEAWCRGYGIDWDALYRRANSEPPEYPADAVRRLSA
jgi:hypothetical protein